MKDSRAQYSSSVAIVLFSILVIGVAIYLMVGLSKNVKESRLQNAIAKLEGSQLNDKKKALDQAILTLKTKQQDIVQFKAAMPMTASLPEAFSQIEGIVGQLSAANSGVSVKSYQISPPADADGKIPVSFTLESDLANLISSTKRLQDNLRPFSIDSINITSTDKPIFSVTLSTAINYNPTTPPKAAAAATIDVGSTKEEVVK